MTDWTKIIESKVTDKVGDKELVNYQDEMEWPAALMLFMGNYLKQKGGSYEKRS